MRTELPVREIIVQTGWRERLEAFAGRRRDSWVLIAVMAGAVVLGLVLWARGAPATVAPPARSSAPQEQDSFAPAAVPSPEPVLLVHVAGAVRRPGLYEMPAGARIADAVQAARGPTGRSDLDALNLAEPLQDGLKIDVPRRGEAVAAAPAPQSGASAAAPAAPVNLNVADQAALETIPEIGPVTAAAILEYRSQVGSFSSVEELLEVSGVGPATLEAMRPYVTV
ncbi:MAG: helix-hairpin-helix domain-containing protein [Actinobacteria bacterium]|nr:helix-hairpin-helix domain-containing protein [Actinomycetota bacterium]